MRGVGHLRDLGFRHCRHDARTRSFRAREPGGEPAASCRSSRGRGGDGADSRRGIAERSRAVDARDEFLAIASHERSKRPTALPPLHQTELRSLRPGSAGRSERTRFRPAGGGKIAHGWPLRLEKLIEELLEVSRIIWGRPAGSARGRWTGGAGGGTATGAATATIDARCQVIWRGGGAGAVGGIGTAGARPSARPLIGNAASTGMGKAHRGAVRVCTDGKEQCGSRSATTGSGIDPGPGSKSSSASERAGSSRQSKEDGSRYRAMDHRKIRGPGDNISLMSKPGAGLHSPSSCRGVARPQAIDGSHEEPPSKRSFRAVMS